MDSTFWSPGDFQWFDGYNEQPIVIIDDYRGEYPVPMFLKLLDRYPMQVPIKGGFVNWSPKKIYITSNVEPRHWYNEVDGRSLAAISRRFTEVTYIDKPIYEDIQ